MANDTMAPLIDKILHADGSVTTMSGELLLPADPHRAAEYQTRSAIADKRLHPDGSVTDGTGRVIMGADESRAEDYANRVAVAVVTNGGDNMGNTALNIREELPVLTAITHIYLEEIAEDRIALDMVAQVTDTAEIVLK